MFCCCPNKKNKVAPPQTQAQTPRPPNRPQQRPQQQQYNAYQQALNPAGPRFNTVQDNDDLTPIPLALFNSMVDNQNLAQLQSLLAQDQEQLYIPSFNRKAFLNMEKIKYIERPPQSVVVDLTIENSLKQADTLKSEFSLLENKPALIKSIEEVDLPQERHEQSLFTSRDLGAQKKSAPAPEQDLFQALHIRSIGPTTRKIQDKRQSMSNQRPAREKDYSMMLIQLSEGKNFSMRPSLIAKPKKQTEKDVYRYLCPICFRYFTELYKFECCGNHICHLCIDDIEGAMLKKKLKHSECCFCRALDPQIEPVQKEDHYKKYIDTPMKSRLPVDRGSQTNKKDKQQNSVLKKYTKNTEKVVEQDPNIIQTSAINKKKIEATLGILHPKIGKKHRSVIYGGDEMNEESVREEDYELRLEADRQTYFPSQLAYVIKQKQKERRSYSTQFSILDKESLLDRALIISFICGSCLASRKAKTNNFCVPVQTESGQEMGTKYVSQASASVRRLHESLTKHSTRFIGQ